MSTPAVPPNQTLYCTNLPTKIQKEDLRRSLYLLFSTYGSVLDVVALKTAKMRGQAHVVFKDVQSSTQAMRALQGMEFFGTELKIAYAKSKSHTIAKLDGTFNIPSPDTTGLAVPGASAQPSIFNAPGGLVAPTAAGVAAPAQAPSPATAGSKRPRDESDGEEGDAPMDEDESEMEMSDDD